MTTTDTKSYLGFQTYDDMYQFSISDYGKERYWQKVAQNISWMKEPKKILDSSKAPFYKWFPDATLNITISCVDRWAEKTPDAPALIYEGRIANKVEVWSFKKLKEELELFAGVLTNIGITKGDRVLIYMPNMNLSICAMLACARVGAIHSVVFGGFAPTELASRIRDSGAKLILSASCGLEPGKKIDYAKNIRECLNGILKRPDFHVIYVNRPELLIEEKNLQKNEFLYDQLRAKSFRQGPVEVESTHPLYLLYTSGSTGQPKGVERDCGGTAVALWNTLQVAFDLGQGDCMFATSDIGWVVGHSFMAYGPLILGAANIIYEGKPNTGHSGVYWELINKYNVKVFYTSPTAMRFLRKADPNGDNFKKYDVNCLKHFGIVGERTDLHTYSWIKSILPNNCIYNDNWWQTETGHIMSGNLAKPQIFEPTPGCCIKPYPGWDIRI